MYEAIRNLIFNFFSEKLSQALINNAVRGLVISFLSSEIWS
jgi:hypothetical protein